MSLVRAIDDWVRRGDFTSHDVAIFRVIYAAAMLLTVPDFRWLDAYPDSMFDPPLGPFMLLNGFPGEWFLASLEVAVVLFATAVLFGIFTRSASVLLTLTLLVGYGFSYSLGKIDHNILFVLLPALMALADWGRSMSWDALHRSPPQAQPQWPLRLVAVLIGIGFATAAAPKVLTGWLSTSSQATQGHFWGGVIVYDRTDLLANQFLLINNGFFWELLDWSTVFIEASVLIAVLSWRSTRIVLAVLTLFHLGVLLMMNIAFYTNVVAYGAVFLWSRLTPRSVDRVALSVRWSWAMPTAAALVATLAFIAHDRLELTRTIAQGIVCIGAALGLAYLVFSVLQLTRRNKRVSTGPK